jgi:hypothetical protein
MHAHAPDPTRLRHGCAVILALSSDPFDRRVAEELLKSSDLTEQ